MIILLSSVLQKWLQDYVQDDCKAGDSLIQPAESTHHHANSMYQFAESIV